MEEPKTNEYEVVLKFKSNTKDLLAFHVEFFNVNPHFKNNHELTRQTGDNDSISEILERALNYEALFLSNVDAFVSINSGLSNDMQDNTLINPEASCDISRSIGSIRNSLVQKRKETSCLCSLKVECDKDNNLE